jgi:hypothetical protein
MIPYRDMIKNQKLIRSDICKICNKKLFPEERRVGHLICYDCRKEERNEDYEE